MRKFQTPSISAMSIALAAGLCACGGSINSQSVGVSSGQTPDTDSAFRVVNGISDSATIGASLDGGGTSTIAFGASSPLTLNFASGSYPVQITPSTAANAFTVSNVGIATGTMTTVFTSGLQGSGSQTGFQAQESLTPSVSSGYVVVQGIHAASQMVGDALYVDLIPPPYTGAATASMSPGLYTGVSSSTQLAAGSYEIVVSEQSAQCYEGTGFCTTTASPSAIFSSGTKGISLVAGNVFQIAVIDATAAQDAEYGSPVSVLVLDSAGNTTQLFNGQD